MRICFALLAAWVVSPLAVACAGTIVKSDLLPDHYIGSNDSGYGDVVGNESFEVYGSKVHLTDEEITFTINTEFVDNPNALGTEYGDLFFTVGDYTPYTVDDGLSSPQYGLGDNWMTGTEWTHAIQLEGDLLSADGLADLYSVDTGSYRDAIRLSNDFESDFPDNADYREGQEVRLNTLHAGNERLTTGSGTWARDKGENTLTISLNVVTADFFDLTSGGVAWHWTMTCGNDTVEDFASFDPIFPPPPQNSLPEPHSLAIFAFGAIGLAGTAYRKRRRAKA